MKSENKLIKVIFEDPERRFHIRELARETKSHPNTVTKIVNNLAKENIVNKKKNIHEVEISLKLESKEYKKKKILFNLNSIYNSEILEELLEFYNKPRGIVLFGSYLRGEDSKESDIDFVVITNNKNKPNVEKYEKRLKRKIHVLNVGEKEKISNEFYNNIINGYVLYGYLELK